MTDSRRASEDDVAVSGRSPWLPPGVSGRPPVASTPAPTRSNRFQPTNDPLDALADRVQSLESRLDAQIEATQRAFGRELHALIKVVETLAARIEALERSAELKQAVTT